MSDELHTLITGLLPPSCQMRLTQVTVAQAYVLLQLTATAPTAACLYCAVPSSSIHSRYQRHRTDLPWGTRAVCIQLMVRKFVCRQPSCTRRIFTERLPDVVAPSARQTTRLIAVLRAIGVALGGQAGTRLAARLWLSTAIVCPAAKRSDDAQRYLDQLCQMDANIARAQTLIQAFLTMVRERQSDHLEAWMAEAEHSGLDELARFARGLQDDLPAIKAGLTLAWSNGVTEGQIHRLKLVKRQGYGRAGFALLRQRVLQVA